MTSAHPDLAGGRLTIDLGALVRNWQKLAALSAPAACGAVVKANAYGCGIEPVVSALTKAGCTDFFVAVAEEGLRVRASAPQSRCFILNGLFPKAAPHLHAANLIPVLGSLAEVETWVAFARSIDKPLTCALHMDSGMNRLGLSPEELAALVSDPNRMAWLDVALFMTHYACADDIGHEKTYLQREIFAQASALLPGVACSAANSPATLQPDDHGFNLARPGVAIYGGEALNDVPNQMEAVATLEGRIIQIRNANAGDAVGYGASETLTRDTRIAYVSVGYADGYHRGASHMGVPMRMVAPASPAAFRGQKVNGIGRISMDMCGFDVTDIDDIQAGDWLELFGPTIAIDEVARAAGTIGYELLTGLGDRYSRVYVED